MDDLDGDALIHGIKMHSPLRDASTTESTTTFASLNVNNTLAVHVDSALELATSANVDILLAQECMLSAASRPQVEQRAAKQGFQTLFGGKLCQKGECAKHLKF